jgi:hypothetical protein
MPFEEGFDPINNLVSAKDIFFNYFILTLGSKIYIMQYMLLAFIQL